MRSLLIALTLTATTAWSQTALQLSLPNNDDELRVPKGPCDLTRTVNWAHGITTLVCDDLKFWIAETCSDEPPSGTTLVDSVAKEQVLTNRSGTVSFEVGELPLFKGGETQCPAEGRQVEYKLCASIPIAGGLSGDCSSNSKNYQKDDVDVTYDAQPPEAPSIERISPLDGALSVRVTVPDDTSELKLHIERTDGSGGRDLRQSSDQSLFKVENLENGVTYRLTATAVDAADNESAASEAQEGTPIHTLGFFDRYVEAKGQEMGGCGAAAGGLASGWVLVALGFWLSSRRNRS
ncbi:MXAN_2561 family MXYO-CTERM-anchored protein [Hyalangium gracile]|uniref:MXAN_2561 family MXYO-CTERM-anchored protein n=1 Tax=Hyalangium gracile TaxID=394092 RepID=UPI001CCE7018|nr:MXAN_2561 family MXYO-CTERM-anchored protein [Hyalangium gracile]